MVTLRTPQLRATTTASLKIQPDPRNPTYIQTRFRDIVCPFEPGEP